MRKFIYSLLLTGFLFAGLFCLLFLTHYYLIQRPLTEKAYSSLQLFESHPYYNSETAKIGRLPENHIPSSYLNSKEEKSAGKKRLGFFGDSNTDNTEIAPGFEFPSQLQKMLGGDYEILNFSLGGLNSNQIYLMIKYFSLKFHVDTIVLGPRGFYTYRAATFNNYWNQGEIPYARLHFDESKLTEIEIEGQNLRDKINNYYSFFPTYNSLFFDQSPPGSLKLIDSFFKLEWTNPFAAAHTTETMLRSAQIESIKSILSFFSGKIIHYTDYPSDCQVFSTIKHERYHLHCTDLFVNDFPFMARVSHPSTFGHFRHARNLMRIMNSENEWDKNEFRFIDDTTNLSPRDETRPNKRRLNIHNLIARINSVKVAEVKAAQKYLDRTGRLSSIPLEEQNQNSNYFYLGFHDSNETRANSMILSIPISDSSNTLIQGIPFEKINGFDNFGFIGLPEINVRNQKQWIEIDSKTLESHKALIDKFFEVNTSHRKIQLHPKFTVYKFVVDEDIDPLTVFQNDDFTGRVSFEVISTTSPETE